MHHHVSSYHSRRDSDTAIKGGMTPEQQQTLIIVVVVLSVVVILGIAVPIVYFKCIHRRGRQTPDPEACNACANAETPPTDPEMSFLQRHVARLRAWKKPPPPTEEAYDKHFGLTDLFPTIPKPVPADKRYNGRPMDFYTHHRRFYRVSGAQPKGVGQGAKGNAGGSEMGNAPPPPVPPKDGARRYNPYFGGLARSAEQASRLNPFHGGRDRYR